MSLAPIILFVFNRPWHTRQTLESLRCNDLAAESELFVFSDGARNDSDRDAVAQVRECVRQTEGFRRVEVVERSENRGLARSVIDGVSEVIGRYGKVIVMEDDLLTAPNFLTFMNQALDLYRDNHSIFSITGLNFPIPIPPDYREQVYLSYRSSSWGWGTWRDRWEKADWAVRDFEQFIGDREARRLFNRGGEDLADMLALQLQGKIDSWAIRWAYTHFRHNAWCLFPTRSKVLNIGFDDSGTHCGKSGKYSVTLDDGRESVRLPSRIEPDERIIRAFARFHRYPLRTRLARLLGIRR